MHQGIPTMSEPMEIGFKYFPITMGMAEMLIGGLSGLILGLAVAVLGDALLLGLLSGIGSFVVALIICNIGKNSLGPSYIFEVQMNLGMTKDYMGVFGQATRRRVLGPEPHPMVCAFRGGRRDLGMVVPIDRYFPPGGFGPGLPGRTISGREVMTMAWAEHSEDAMQDYIAKVTRG